MATSYMPEIETSFTRAEAFLSTCKGIEKMIEVFSPVTDGIFRMIESINVKNPDKDYVRYLATITHSFVLGLNKKMEDSPDEFKDLYSVWMGVCLGTQPDNPKDQMYIESSALSLCGIYQSMMDSINEVKKMFYDSNVSGWKKMYIPEIEKSISNVYMELEQYINDSEIILKENLSSVRPMISEKIKVTDIKSIRTMYDGIFDALQNLYVVYANNIAGALLRVDIHDLRDCEGECNTLKDLLTDDEDEVDDDF